MCSVDFDGAGRGEVASRDLDVGDTALEIPASLIICEELVYESEMVILWNHACCSCRCELIQLPSDDQS